MPYGTIKCDNITFDNGGTDKLLTVSGLFFSTSGALTVTGTIAGGNVTAPTATFTTLTGTTTAGTTATFTSGSFTSLTGVTTTVTSGIFGLGSAAAPSITFSGDSNTGIYSPGADQVAISINGSDRLFIDSLGRLLAGTSTARSNFFGTTLSAVTQTEGTGGATGRGALSVINNDVSNNPPYVLLGRSGAATLGSNATVISGSRLGTLTFHGADGTSFIEAATVAGEVDGTPGASDMPGRLVFSTTADGAPSPTERMRIDNAGNINTYTTGNFSLALGTSSGAGTTNFLLVGVYNRTGTVTGGSISIQIYSNGNVQNTNNSYGAISDIKLKENIVDANPQWDDIKALQVRNFNFKEGQTHTQLGVVANEIELISPGLVTESPDRDAEGNDLGTVTKSVNYSVLYMKAVKALQEAMERIESLEAKVAALESA